jgi:hypothetical protein
LTTIATSSTTSISIAQLIAGGSSAPQTPAASSASDSFSATSSASSYGAAAFVTLSEQAKQAAATKLVTDQTAADQLQAYVAAHRANANNAGSAQSLFSEATSSTTGSQPQTATTGDKVQVIVAQIQTVADANAPQPFQTFTPTKSLSNSVTVDGYTLSLDTNASTQFYGIDLTGNGVTAYNKHFGPSDGGGGVTAVPPGVSISIGTPGNNEAIDSITITQNVASADSASISTPSGSASTSSVNAQSSSITFLVNYATGAISVQQSALSVSAQSSSVAPGSTLSTLA